MGRATGSRDYERRIVTSGEPHPNQMSTTRPSGARSGEHTHWNDDPKPFVWHKTAEEIIAKVRRGRAALTHVTKSATDH